MDRMRWTEQSASRVGCPTIKNHSVTHFGDYLFCFGGYDGRRNHMTLLIYSILEQRWFRPHHAMGTEGQGSNFLGDPSFLVQGTPPPGRNGHSATLAADPEDEENGRVIIIGGWLGTGPLAASDMHVLDISGAGRQLRWYQPPIKGTPPGPCNMHSADYVSALKEVFVFRGGNGREYLNDLHALHVETLTWRRVETTGAIPQQRANHSSAFLEETQELFVFGGWNGTERLNDIHILDTATNTWTCPRVGGVLPHPRAGMTLTALRGRLYLFGGSGTSAKCFQDLQILDRQTMAWLDVTQYETGRNGHHDSEHETTGTFRFGGSHTLDDGQSHMYGHLEETPRFTFGGAQQDNSLDDNQEAVARPPQQGGGQDGASHSLGSFTSSRADWHARDMAARHRQPALPNISPNPNDEDSVPAVLIDGTGPGRRAGHTATAVHRKIFVFGGSCGSDYLNDFFVLDTDPPPHALVSEPTSVQLFERRLRHFFNDEEFSDVTFVVQGEKVYGHKMVLSIVSDCFRAMFTTGFRESEAMEIEIPDCSHASFLSVMEYVYTGALPKMDMANQDRDRSLTRVVEMLELSDRFFLDHLKQICESILQPAVTHDTAEYLLGIAQKTNASQLQSICEHFVRNRNEIA